MEHRTRLVFKGQEFNGSLVHSLGKVDAKQDLWRLQAVFSASLWSRTLLSGLNAENVAPPKPWPKIEAEVFRLLVLGGPRTGATKVGSKNPTLSHTNSKHLDRCVFVLSSFPAKNNTVAPCFGGSSGWPKNPRARGLHVDEEKFGCRYLLAEVGISGLDFLSGYHGSGQGSAGLLTWIFNQLSK